ncbi:MAG: hypothetical protein QW505_05390, partial [Thermoplasmata archaeon]
MDDSIEIMSAKHIGGKHNLWELFERGIALAVLVIMLVAVAQTAVTTGAAQTTKERILTLAMGEPIDSPNPFVGITDNAYIFFGLVYDYMMTPDENMVNQPNLALEWYPMDGSMAAAGGTDFSNAADFPTHGNA